MMQKANYVRDQAAKNTITNHHCHWPEYETVWQMIEARCTGNQMTEQAKLVMEALWPILGGNHTDADTWQQINDAVLASLATPAPKVDVVEWRPISKADEYKHAGEYIFIRGRNSADRPMVPVSAYWTMKGGVYGWFCCSSGRSLSHLIDDIPSDSKGADFLPVSALASLKESSDVE